MHPSYCFFLFSVIISLSRAWKEWTDTSATPSSTINTLLYAGAVSFISWSQSDANNLCASGQCGPYCDSACDTTTTRNVAILPAPSGATTGLTNQDPGCPDNCCSTENCLRTLNANGDDIGLSKEYVLIFGGRQVSASSTSELLFDTCEVDFLQVKLDGTCTGTPKNDLLLIDLDGNVTKPVVPTYNTDTDTTAQIPSARYGHKSVYMERTEFDSTANINITRKYMYIYGGYSPDCNGYCNDLWRYEIPWAAQRYYPQGSTYWKRGNYWEKMVTAKTPGKKSWFSFVSDSKEYIYLYGGAKQLDDNSRIYTNDLWRYSVTNNTWERIVLTKVSSIQRPLRLWDGTYRYISVDVNSRKNGDLVSYLNITPSDCMSDTEVPSCRAFSSMSLDNDTSRLILAGGLNPNVDTNIYRKSIWSFDLKTQVWSILMNDSDTIRTPGSTAYASNTYLKGDFYRFQFYFGGIVSEDEKRDSLWAYDFVLNKSVELVKQPLSDTQTYPRINKGMVLVRLVQKRGLFLFGGYLKQDLNSTMTAAKTAYTTSCSSSLTTNGLKVTDAFTSAWATKYAATGDQCFATVPAWLTAENQFTLSNKMWMYLESFCRVTNDSLGNCFWGRSKCNPGLYGADCSSQQCLNSMCYQEKTSLANAACIHCFGKGQCLNGECECEPGYTYEDCSGTDCPNNCSNTATKTVATCNLMYPLSVCECFTEKKRGGDDCSYVFCLNDCGGHGTCTDGECSCDDNYYGTDCSIFDIEFIDTSFASRFNYVNALYLVFTFIAIFA